MQRVHWNCDDSSDRPGRPNYSHIADELDDEGRLGNGANDLSVGTSLPCHPPSWGVRFLTPVPATRPAPQARGRNAAAAGRR